jgi:predicted metal-dependent HD superfamily phosphohydrolase
VTLQEATLEDTMTDSFQFEEARFARPWRALGARDLEAFERVCEAYASPGRHYHSVEHVLECLAYFDRVRERAVRPDELEIAIYFHDAVYDVSRNDNEARSAELAHAAALDAGIARERADEIARLVATTAHGSAAPHDPDACLLADIDLSILGASPERYRRYEADIRLEYARFPDALYQPGRLKVLDSFLERTAIYTTPYFYDRLERQARENLAQATHALHAGA